MGLPPVLALAKATATTSPLQRGISSNIGAPALVRRPPQAICEVYPDVPRTRVRSSSTFVVLRPSALETVTVAHSTQTSCMCFARSRPREHSAVRR